MLVALDILTVLALIVGMFFLFIGALGIVRLPDLYSRMHAASKCITLGISGMVLAAVFHFVRIESTPAGAPRPADDPPAAADPTAASPAVAAVTKAVLVIIFQFVAAPVAVHMLARAAHRDGVPAWEGIIRDELSEDYPPEPSGADAPDTA